MGKNNSKHKAKQQRLTSAFISNTSHYERIREQAIQIANTEMNNFDYNNPDTDRTQAVVPSTNTELNERYISVNVQHEPGDEGDEHLNTSNTSECSVSTDSSSFVLRRVTGPKDDPMYYYPSEFVTDDTDDTDSQDESDNAQYEVVYDSDHGIIPAVSNVEVDWLAIEGGTFERSLNDDDDVRIVDYVVYSEEDDNSLTDDRGLSTDALERLPVKHARASNDTCSVCFEKYEAGDLQKVLPCFHLFHPGCIDQWLQESTTCPVCRTYVQIADE